jgi:hypothetical protein
VHCLELKIKDIQHWGRWHLLRIISGREGKVTGESDDFGSGTIAS